jgi:hypothetical protein
MTHEEGRCRAFDVFAAGVDKTFPTAKFFVVAIRIQASVELAASGLLDIDPDRGRKHEGPRQHDPVLGHSASPR